jgi:hypothetical protein
MGVDPGLVDLEEKTPATSVHIMSRDEIRKFGIETRGQFETQWMLFEEPVGLKRLLMIKAITQGRGVDGGEYRTIVVRMTCEQPGRGIWVFYQRELASSEIDVPIAVRVAVDKNALDVPDITTNAVRFPRTTANGANDIYAVMANRDFIRKALSVESIVFTEAQRQHGDMAREIKLATIGSERGLQTLLNSCGDR